MAQTPESPAGGDGPAESTPDPSLAAEQRAAVDAWLEEGAELRRYTLSDLLKEHADALLAILQESGLVDPNLEQEIAALLASDEDRIALESESQVSEGDATCESRGMGHRLGALTARQLLARLTHELGMVVDVGRGKGSHQLVGNGQASRAVPLGKRGRKVYQPGTIRKMLAQLGCDPHALER